MLSWSYYAPEKCLNINSFYIIPYHVTVPIVFISLFLSSALLRIMSILPLASCHLHLPLSAYLWRYTRPYPPHILPASHEPQVMAPSWPLWLTIVFPLSNLILPPISSHTLLYPSPLSCLPLPISYLSPGFPISYPSPVLPISYPLLSCHQWRAAGAVNI